MVNISYLSKGNISNLKQMTLDVCKQ